MRRVKGLSTLRELAAAAATVKLTGRRCALKTLIGRLRTALVQQGETLPEAVEEIGCFLAAVLHNKPCHCCIIFTRRSHQALYRNRFLRNQHFDYGYRESGLSPPTSSL